MGTACAEVGNASALEAIGDGTQPPPFMLSGHKYFKPMSVACDQLECVGLGSVVSNVSVSAVCKTPLKKTSARPGLTRLRAKADSGCGEHVLPDNMLVSVPTKESPEVSTTYKTASGRILCNGGMKEIRGQTVAGDRIEARWQVVPGLKQPLLSLGKLAENGNRIVLDDAIPGGGFILHKKTGKKTPLEKVGNTYECDLFVEEPPFTRPA